MSKRALRRRSFTARELHLQALMDRTAERMEVLALGIGEDLKRSCGYSDALRRILDIANELLIPAIKEAQYAEKQYREHRTSKRVSQRATIRKNPRAGAK